MQGSAEVFQSAKLSQKISAGSSRRPVRLNNKTFRLSAGTGHVSTGARSCRGKIVSEEGWGISSGFFIDDRQVANLVVLSRSRRKNRVDLVPIPAPIVSGRRTSRCRTASIPPLLTSLFIAGARQDTKWRICPSGAVRLDTKKQSPCRALYFQPSPPFGSR